MKKILGSFLIGIVFGVVGLSTGYFGYIVKAYKVPLPPVTVKFTPTCPVSFVIPARLGEKPLRCIKL